MALSDDLGYLMKTAVSQKVQHNTSVSQLLHAGTSGTCVPALSQWVNTSGLKGVVLQFNIAINIA